jgi:replicative DNA helicase
MMDVKQPPYNADAEQNVLGAIFLDGNTIKTVIDRLEIDDFFILKHRLIYEAMRTMFEGGMQVDYTTLTDHLMSRELLVSAGGADYILQLSDTTPSVANLEYYINIVKDKAVIRNMIEVSKQIAEEGFHATDMASFVDESERRIFEVASSRRTSGFVKLHQVADEVITKTEKAKLNTGSVTGLDTGFEELNRYTLGLQKEELYIIAGRPSMGKSAFALNIATNVCKSHSEANVAIFSLEMGVEQLVGRMLSAESRVLSQKIKLGDLSTAEWEQLSLASTKLSKLNILFDDSGTVKVTDLRQKCRKLAQEGHLDLVIIDYLQLLSASKPNPNRVQEVSEISRTLKEMARELKIPVIALSQLSRNVESRNDKRPIMADLRESGSIEQDADVILFLYRDDYYNQESQYPDQVDIIIAKNRSGATVIEGIPLLFKKAYSTFKTLKQNVSSVDESIPDIS